MAATARIEKLTKHQERILPKFHDEWLRWGINTARSDKPRAEAAILAMRSKIGVANHPIFVWCDSPATSLLAIEILKSEQLEKFLGDSLGASLGASLKASLWDSLGGAWWGQHDSYWIAFYLFCRDLVGVKYEKSRSHQLDMWRDIAQSCCWWWCYENYVIISERPTIVAFDDRNRIHAEKGPAIAFADGWEVFAWHGVRVPSEWIQKPMEQDPAQALIWQNVEQRRALAEIIGWKRILEALSPTVIEQDSNPQIGTLLSVDLPQAPGSRFLKVRCGTGRDFVLPVPREMRTALEANAWTYGLNAKDYQLEVRT